MTNLVDAENRQTDIPLKKAKKNIGMTWLDHLVMLLHIGASIEHALLVQYLYAAYSIGGEQVPEEHRAMVREWQETILAVAREEMGHLLTVQNVLTLLGAGIMFNRRDLPWDIEYYPFPFILEPFSRGSLACYIYAEMPLHEDYPERGEVEALAKQHAVENGSDPSTKLHEVGEIYTEIMELVADRERIPDNLFHEQSIRIQASWDDWGRGYQPKPRMLDSEGNLMRVTMESHKAAQFEAHVMIDRVATRTQALEALKKLSIQGEGPNGLERADEWSHFSRFIKIFREYETIKDQPWSPSLPIPKNPNTIDDDNALHREGWIPSTSHARIWADLFNLRYRILFSYLAHTFRLALAPRGDEPSLRAMMMHRIFAEMYNLKTISGILVQLPLREGRAERAGPPFEMPFNVRLPEAEGDAWQLHLDMLGLAQTMCNLILANKPRPEDCAYVRTLADLDLQTANWIEGVLIPLRYSA